MKLNLESIKNQKQWQDAGYALPAFDVEAMRARTLENPTWIHFGAGNIFRAFPAVAQQRLLNENAAATGIIACEGFDCDIIDKAFAPFDDLSVLALLRRDGAVDKTVIASVARALRLDREEDNALLDALIEKPSLQMLSFTITEKGYAVKNAAGAALPFIQSDIDGAPEAARSTIGRVAYLLLRRYTANALPLALVSMDNCSHNGDKLKEAVLTVAEGWRARGAVDGAFIDYICDPAKVSFPLTMIDKITPRPDEKVARMLAETGLEDTQTIVTGKNTYTAAFVNAEEKEYLVIEDSFPNGRPPLQRAGLYFTDRETVDKVERMKVCTCLNPLHTALAVLGCLLNYPTISSEMEQPALRKLVERIAYSEGMPVVVDPGILDPMEFARSVIEERLPNPFMPDTPQRIATDTSQKLSIRFGRTIEAYRRSDALDVESLECIPFVLAAWIRYLTGVSDRIQPFEISPDPMLEELKEYIAPMLTGGGAAAVVPLLRREDIFGVDLMADGIGDKVIAYLAKMMRGKGAVYAALVELVGV